MHTLARFCESRRRFFSLLSLKYLYISFFLSAPACRVFRCPFRLSPSGTPPKLSGGLPSCLLCLVVLWWLPSLVRHQAQNAMTVGADAARKCPRPCLLLPMCCRVSRWLFRVLFRGFRPSVRVCVLLPCVVWW